MVAITPLWFSVTGTTLWNSIKDIIQRHLFTLFPCLAQLPLHSRQVYHLPSLLRDLLSQEIMHIQSILLIACVSSGALASVTCLTVGATATATWTNSDDESCVWSGTVGSNFGTNSVTGGDYSCNGRCGSGCTGTSVGNAYTQDCFSHDICSWFNDASDGASDANCGAAYVSAVDDTLFGVIDGCGQTNPSNSAEEPTTSPVCS
ncbi:hypothetical protein BJ878DRAFT_461138 [Calycina marina]|uniref:DUF8213 domain-containing protein n=1 Tax=Calycina marina TaxID=1763456 RepID=A0A9P7Z361_9HELO|nr:hypothetical protein BJ878DRAFT_461138 [Calycina marina]